MCQAVLVRMIVSGRTSRVGLAQLILRPFHWPPSQCPLSTGVAGVVEYDPAMGTGAVVALNPW